MVGRVLVDTGAILALANPRDQYHAEAVGIARPFFAAGGRCVGTALVLAEVHGHLLQLRGPGAARTVLSDLLEDPAYEWLDVPTTLIRDAMAQWLTRYSDQRFSLTNAVSFSVMRAGKLTTAFAFDNDFLTAGFQLLR